jgi:DNA-binding CsgD family transcriptional regulator
MVRILLDQIYTRLGINSRAALASYVTQSGLLQFENPDC